MRPAGVSLGVACWLACVAVAGAQVYPDEPVGDTDPALRSDFPEERLVDTADAELPPTPVELPDTSAGFFEKVLQNRFPNPERAAALSFVLPGAGQIYNKRFAWIKVPVIVAGYTGLIYAGEQNRDFSKRLKQAYRDRLISQDTITEFDRPPLRIGTDVLRIRALSAEKNFQLSYIGLVVFHLVQTLEAYTTAHLLEFDMDESLSVRPSVTLPPTGFGVSRPALAITWRPPHRPAR